MKNIILFITLILFFSKGQSQINLEISGDTKLPDLQIANSVDSFVVQLHDGTLAIRDRNSLKSDLYLGKDTLDGVIFYIYQDENGEEKALLVSNIETSEIWQTANSLTLADRRWDGEYNTNLMNNSPAKNWVVTNFSSEWYIPSIDELILLWHNQFHVNKTMYENGFEQIANDNSLYWSSTEFDQNTVWTYSARFGNIAGTLPKSNTNLLRAIRKI